MTAFLWILGIVFLVVFAIFLGRLLAYNKRRSPDNLNLMLNGAMLSLTVLSLMVAILAFADSKKSGNEQAETLRRSRESLQDVVTTLQTQAQLLRAAQGILQSQLEVSRQQQTAIKETTNVLQITQKTLKSQSDIVNEENQRDLATLSSKARIHFTFDNIEQENFAQPHHLSTRNTGDLLLTVSNDGEQALANPKLWVYAVPETVSIFKPTVPLRVSDKESHHLIILNSPKELPRSIDPSRITNRAYSLNIRLMIPDTVDSFHLVFSISGGAMPVHQAILRLIVDPSASK